MIRTRRMFGLAVVVAFLAGCRGEAVERRSVGTLVSGGEVATSFNESMKSLVNTTGGTFTVYGSFSAVKGDVTLIRYRNGREYLRVAGNEKEWEVIDR